MDPDKLKKNKKKNAIAFYELMFNENKPAEAIDVNTSTLLHNIGRKNKPFERHLTLNYWINKFSSVIKNHFFTFRLQIFRAVKRKLLDHLVFRLDDMAAVLHEIYQDSAKISPQEAGEVYPDLKKIRKEITRQKNKFATIDFAGSKEAQTKFYRLVRLVNRLESRVYKRMQSETEVQDSSQGLRERSIKSRKRAHTGGV